VADRFHAPIESRDWFKKLDFSIRMYDYYFCLMLGLVKKRKASDEEMVNSEEFVEYFPEPFGSGKNKIISLFLETELSLLGIDLSNREAVQKILTEYITPNSLTWLTKKGLSEMDKYCAGGFEILRDEFDDRPASKYAFFLNFERLITEALATTD